MYCALIRAAHQRQARPIRAAVEKALVVMCVRRDGLGKTTSCRKILSRWSRLRRASAIRSAAHRRAFRGGATSPTSSDQSRALVGYKVRFHESVRPDTAISMTDGILLAETQAIRAAAVRSIILDEAHERSLNIDF